MGTRSRSVEPGAFGSKQFCEVDGDIASIVRPNRGRDRSKHRRVGVRGSRGLTFGDVLKHNVMVKKKEEAAKKPGLSIDMGKIFQRKGA